MTEELKELKTKLKTATPQEVIEELEYCGRDPYYGDIYEIVVTEIKERLIAAQKMKCCGNCKYCKYDQNEESNEYCEKHSQIVNVAIVACDDWEVDEWRS